MKDYDQLIEDLKSNHLYPIKLTKGDGAMQVTVGLEIYCPSLQKDSRLGWVNEILPDDYSATFFPNDEVIHIIKKK